MERCGRRGQWSDAGGNAGDAGDAGGDGDGGVGDGPRQVRVGGDDASFPILERGITALVGPSGSGKTTISAG
jgi:hypothetical protein